jgi:hypothetical protein
MSQYDFGVIDPQVKTGSQLANDLNNWRDALHSSHTGVARPTYAKPGTVWVDVAAAPVCYLKLFDGVADVAILQFNNSTHAGAVVVAAGGVSFTPVGGIAATNVQAALQELDNEKLARDGTQTMTGDLKVNGAINSLTGNFIGTTGANGVVFLGTVAGTLSGGAITIRDTGATFNPGGLEFYSGSTERMRFDAAGNCILAGTGRRLMADMSNATASNRFAFQSSTPNSLTAMAMLPNGTGTDTYFQLFGAPSMLNCAFAHFALLPTEAQIVSDKVGTGAFVPMSFRVGGNEAMRITTGQSILFGTSTVLSSDANSPGSVTIASAALGLTMRNTTAAVGKWWEVGPVINNGFYIYNQSNVGVFISDGNNAWAAASDERMKTALTPISGAALWDWFKTVRTEHGRFKTDDEGTQRPFLIAQDWTDCPTVTSVQDDGMLALTHTNTLPYAYAVLKKAMERIEQLEARVAALEAA